MTVMLLMAVPPSKNDVGTFPEVSQFRGSASMDSWCYNFDSYALQGTVEIEILLKSGFRLGVSVSKVSAFGGLQGVLIGDL